MKKIPFIALWALLALPAFMTACGDDATDEATKAVPELVVRTDEAGVLAVAAAGGSAELRYEVTDPALSGGTATAETDDAWIHDFDTTTPGVIGFVVDENTAFEPRIGHIAVSYPGVRSVTVTVEQEAAAAPIDIAVTEVTVASIKAQLKADDPAMTFLFGLVAKSDFEAAGSDEDFLAAELAKLEAEAGDYWFDTLAEYLDFLLGDWEPDAQKLTREGLAIDTEYCIYAYGIDIEGEVTTPLVKKFVRTEALKEIDFRVATAGTTQTTVTLTADPDDAQTCYFLGYIARQEFETSFNSDDDEVMNNALGNIRLAIGSDGSKLDQVAYKGKASLTVEGLLPGTAYYALAFGIDASVSACTTLTKVPFETQPFAATDDCTFAVDVPSVNSALMSIHVVPTDAATRYYATIKAAAEVAGLTPGQVADAQIAFENGFGMNWAGDKQIFTGEQTLHSRRDIGATHIKPETDYVVYVFGVDEQGVRTTEVATATVTTTAVVPSAMQLTIRSVVAGAETDPDDWFGGKICNFQFEVEPSTEEEYYYVGVALKSEVDAAASDEAFMESVAEQSGEMMIMGCYLGRQAVPFKAEQTYKGETLQSGTEYYVFAFGYMGGVTTGLFKEAATADDGEGGGGDWTPDWPTEW